MIKGEGIGTMKRAVSKQDPEAALAEGGTECHLENKKDVCVAAGGGLHRPCNWELSLESSPSLFSAAVLSHLHSI